MFRRFEAPRLRLLVLIALVLGVGGGVGIASGKIPGGGGEIDGCYGKTRGTLRVIDTEATPPEDCMPSEAPIRWNQTGPQGPPGADGVNGAPGPQGERGPAGPPLASIDALDGVACDEGRGTVDVAYRPTAGEGVSLESVLRCVRPGDEEPPPDCGPAPEFGPGEIWTCESGSWVLQCQPGYQLRTDPELSCVPEPGTLLTDMHLPESIPHGVTEAFGSLRLNGTAGSDTTILLESMAPDLLTVPDHVVVPPGDDSVAFAMRRVDGSSTSASVGVTARLNDSVLVRHVTLLGPFDG